MSIRISTNNPTSNQINNPANNPINNPVNNPVNNPIYNNINYITSKIPRTVGILYRLKDIYPQSVLLTLYNTLILPHFHYCLRKLPVEGTIFDDHSTAEFWDLVDPYIDNIVEGKDDPMITPTVSANKEISASIPERTRGSPRIRRQPHHLQYYDWIVFYLNCTKIYLLLISRLRS